MLGGLQFNNKEHQSNITQRGSGAVVFNLENIQHINLHILQSTLQPTLTLNMCSTVAIRPAQLGPIQIATNLLLKNELIVILENF